MRKEQISQVLEETKKEQSVSSSIDVVYSENVKPRENHLLNNLCYLQNRLNNLNDKKRKTSFAGFKVKQQNIFGLALKDTENLFTFCHSLWGVLGSNIRQYERVHGLQGWDC